VRLCGGVALVAVTVPITGASAIAQAGHPAPGADDGVVVDPIHGGYYPWAHRPGSPAARHVAAGHTAGGGHNTVNPAPDALPKVCKDLLAGSTAGSLVAAPSAVIAATPVSCSPSGPDTTITPQQLAQQAWKGMRLPLPDVRTAPPRGSSGLVGLPEWVWVPRGQWRPQTKQASAGGVWARVTATPERMTVKPGAELPSLSCSGPGTAYDPHKPASGQHTDCSVTYPRSSAAEPGGVYRATVTVTWTGSWTGAGGAGGTLPDITRSTTFTLPVAEAQGLYG
jgi:hypothetical protein